MQNFEQWIEAKDAAYRNAEIPTRFRPFKAFNDYLLEIGSFSRVNDSFTKNIFAWYKEHSKEGTFDVDYMFRGAFYFDGSIYAVEIPISYGRANTVPLNCLKNMKAIQIKMLENDKQEFKYYHLLWFDCLDYGYGVESILEDSSSPLSTVKYASSAVDELNSCVGEILQLYPNSTVIERASMAIEMFLKAALSKYLGYTASKLSRKPYSHNLENLCMECQKISKFQELTKILPIIKNFPPISDRYNKKNYTLKEMFDYYFVAQWVGVMYVRAITGRDSREQIPNQNGSGKA